jgi:hypothetical protein
MGILEVGPKPNFQLELAPIVRGCEINTFYTITEQKKENPVIASEKTPS